MEHGARRGVSKPASCRRSYEQRAARMVRESRVETGEKEGTPPSKVRAHGDANDRPRSAVDRATSCHVRVAGILDIADTGPKRRVSA